MQDLFWSAYWRGDRLNASLTLAVANLDERLHLDIAKLSFLYYSSHLPVQNEDRQRLQFDFSPFREAQNAVKDRDFLELILDFPHCPDLYLHANSFNSSSASLIRLVELLMRRFPGRSDILHRALRIFPQHDIPYESRLLPRQGLSNIFFATDQQDIYHQCKYDWSSFFYDDLFHSYLDLQLSPRGFSASDYMVRLFLLLGFDFQAASLSKSLARGQLENVPMGSLSGFLFVAASLLYSEEFFPVSEFKDTFSRYFSGCDIQPKPLVISERPVLLINSPDLRDHPVGRFWYPIHVELLKKFQVVILSSMRRREDSLSSAFLSMSEIVHLDPCDTLEDQLRVAALFGPSIILDLCGHTADSLPALLANRIAPCQASFLGYFGPLLLEHCDWWIIDKYVNRYLYAEPTVAEARWVLPFFSFSYDPLVHKSLPLVDIPEKPRHNFLRYGSFNHSRKLSPNWFSHASRILSQDQNTLLIFKSHSFIDPQFRRFILQRAIDAGLPVSRLLFLPYAQHQRDSFIDFSRISVHIDSYPVCGTTTTIDALVHGVPVLSMPTGTYAGSISSSILDALGLDSCVASDDSIPKALSSASNFSRYPRAFANDMRDRLADHTTTLVREFPVQMGEMLKASIASAN
jgi:hypothetical protein